MIMAKIYDYEAISIKEEPLCENEDMSDEANCGDISTKYKLYFEKDGSKETDYVDSDKCCGQWVEIETIKTESDVKEIKKVKDTEQEEVDYDVDAKKKPKGIDSEGVDYDDVHVKEEEEPNYLEHDVEMTNAEANFNANWMPSENTSLNKNDIKQQNVSNNIFDYSDGKSLRGNCTKSINSFKCSERLNSKSTFKYIKRSSEVSDSNVVSEENEDSFICSKCNFKTSQQSQLTLHIEGHKVESSVECIESDRDAMSKPDKKHQHLKEKSFKCSHCDYCTARKSNFQIHFRIHTGEKPFTCSYCNYKTSHKSHLNTHVRTHTGEKPFACSHCEYTTSRKSSLKTHFATHTNEKSFKCSYCDFTTSLKLSLTRHVRSHTGEKPFACSQCDYKASDRSYLRKHVAIHTGEKPFKCSYCEYTSLLKSSLTRHVRIHTEKKPFSCSHCEYTTSWKSSFKAHFATHSNENSFKCSYCDYTTLIKSSLTRHVRSHTGEKPFACNHCDYKTSDRSSLRKHVSIHTGEIAAKG